MIRRLLTASVAGLAALAGCSADEPAGVATGLGGHEHPKAGEKVEDAPVPRILPETHLAAGRMLEEQGDIESAIAQYERAIAANPRFTAAYNRLGILHQKAGRSEDARHIFKQGIRADPGAALLRNNLGYCYLVQQRFAEAEKEFREALMVSPEFQRARMNLAIALAHTGRSAESLEEFSHVVSADVAYYNLAVICLTRGDYVGAETALHKALEIDPDCPGAREHLEKVRAIVRASGDGGAGSQRQEAESLAADDREATQASSEAIPLAGTADEEGDDGP